MQYKTLFIQITRIHKVETQQTKYVENANSSVISKYVAIWTILAKRDPYVRILNEEEMGVQEWAQGIETHKKQMGMSKMRKEEELAIQFCRKEKQENVVSGSSG